MHSGIEREMPRLTRQAVTDIDRAAHAVMLVDLVDADDVGMLDLGGRSGLAEKLVDAPGGVDPRQALGQTG